MSALARVFRTVSVSRPVTSVLSSSGAMSQPFLETRRCFVKVGDKVNVGFVKDEPAPVIKEDSEYPDWVFQLSEKLPTKAALMEKFGPDGEGVENMTEAEKKRLKSLLRLQTIRTNNAASSSDA